MLKETHSETGARGEDEAVQFLSSNGYRILERNWQMRKKEVDIICRYQDLIVFVEVKARTEGYMESPLEAVTIKKQRNIVSAAALYIEQFNIDQEARFDIISVVFNQDGSILEIEHIPSAFYPRVARIK